MNILTLITFIILGPNEIQLQHLDGQVEGMGYLFEFTKKNVIHCDGNEHQIIVPANVGEKLAYGFAYSGAAEGILSNRYLFLVEDYDTEKPRFYLDNNLNLDFRDDHPEDVIHLDDGSAKLILKSPKDAKFTFTYQYIPIRLNKKITAETKEQYLKMLGPHFKRMGAKPLAPEYWFNARRLSQRWSQVALNNQKFRIALYDYNVNGVWNDEEDRILIDDYNNKGSLPTRKNQGATDQTENALFMIGQQSWRLVAADPLGLSVKIESTTEKPNRVYVGSVIPDRKLKDLEGNETNLHAFLSPGKVTVLDFWGNWCQPCVFAMPKINTLLEKHGDKMNLVGIHYGDNDKALAMLKKDNYPWPNINADKSLNDYFLIDGWPTYVVLDDQGKILDLNTTLEELDKEFSSQ